MNKFIFLLVVMAQTSFAANDIQFRTALVDQQLEESVKVVIDGKLVCELYAKRGLLGLIGLIKEKNNCSFQPTKKVHKYEIIGSLKVEDKEEPYHGKGEGLILNYYTEYEKLNAAKNIAELFEFYDAGMQAINKELPKDYQLKMLEFAHKESKENVQKHIKQKGIILPEDYIAMITQYGYPQNIDTFIPLSKQKSIADVYLDAYQYPSKYVNKHEGVEKNLAFFNDYDVYFVFHNQTAKFCGEPMIDYTIMTEGYYYPINVDNLESTEDCGSFFEFLKKQVMAGFIENIEQTFAGLLHILPVYRNHTLKANLHHIRGSQEDSIEYSFWYNDVFY